MNNFMKENLHEVWVVDCGPPEMGGQLLLEWLNIYCYVSREKPDNNETFFSKQAAIDSLINRLEQLRYE